MSEQVFIEGDAIEHHMMDALILGCSALVKLGHDRYRVWENYTRLAGVAKANPDKLPHDASVYDDWRQRDSDTLKRLCELVDAAMQFIGDVNSDTDLVDEYGMTDQGFYAMNRALGRPPYRAEARGDLAGPATPQAKEPT